MEFDEVKGWLRALLIRAVFVCAGGIVFVLSLSINMNAGHVIVAGLRSPDSPVAFVISLARLLMPFAGLWLITRGLLAR